MPQLGHTTLMAQMDRAPINWTTEAFTSGVVRIAFTGRGGIGSEGNADGRRMCDAISEVLSAQRPTGLIVDLSGFEYEFGNWMGSVAFSAYETLGKGRACVVASGSTGTALASLWEFGKLHLLLPLFATLDEAREFLSQAP